MEALIPILASAAPAIVTAGGVAFAKGIGSETGKGAGKYINQTVLAPPSNSQGQQRVVAAAQGRSPQGTTQAPQPQPQPLPMYTVQGVYMNG